jgi:hypothetical protein
MADKAKKISARCVESVVEARVKNEWEGSYLVSGRNPIRLGYEAEAMALHPAGLAIVPKIGPKAGERIVIPAACISVVVLAGDEP